MSTGRTAIVALSFSLVLSLGFGPARTAAQDADPRVELDTSAGKIVLELDPQKAPITVENFLKYVDGKFYDGLIFHRVIPGFMIQGGGMSDKMAEKEEGRRASIKNEANNGLSNKAGTIAMARTADPNSATCQFFINHKDNASGLDPNARNGGGYAVFGKVIEGMDVVDAIAKVETTTVRGHGDVPVKPIYIKSARRVTK